MKHTPIRDALRFFGTFVRNPGRVGAVLPSSRYLADALVGDLSELQPGDLVVEYGPGTGSMTRVIADRLPAGVDYLGIELDAGFCDLLRARFPGLRFHLGSVADVEQIPTELDLCHPELIISGLPFASLPPEVQRGIVDSTRAVLDDGGQFRAFQYLHAYSMPSAGRFRRAMGERFEGIVRERAVIRNVPPAYVLTWS